MTVQRTVFSTRPIAAMIALAAAIGCGDGSLPPGPAQELGGSVDSPLAALSGPLTQNGLNAIARSIAMAMQDDSIRVAVHTHLRESRVTPEHKLHLQHYLGSAHGSGLLRAMAKYSGASDTQLLARLQALRGLEFYMPVDEHRETWTGNADVIVATQLKEGESPIGYGLDGTRMTLSATEPPTTPVLAVVTAEADFREPLPDSWQNFAAKRGTVIGTYRQPSTGIRTLPGVIAYEHDDCDPEHGDPTQPHCQPAPPPEVPAGTYLDYSNIVDLGEDWVRGDPEIEVHLIGPVAFEGNPGEHLSCSGGYVSGPKWFNQDGNTWVRQTPSQIGVVTGAMFLKTDYDQYYLTYQPDRPIGYQFWEDDDQTCLIRGDVVENAFQEFYQHMRQLYNTTSVIVSMLNATTWVFSASNVTTIQGTFNSEDDFIGVAVDQAALGYNYPDATHVLIDYSTTAGSGIQSFYNGRVRLINITQ